TGTERRWVKRLTNLTRVAELIAIGAIETSTHCGGTHSTGPAADFARANRGSGVRGRGHSAARHSRTAPAFRSLWQPASAHSKLYFLRVVLFPDRFPSRHSRSDIDR